MEKKPKRFRLQHKINAIKHLGTASYKKPRGVRKSYLEEFYLGCECDCECDCEENAEEKEREFHQERLSKRPRGNPMGNNSENSVSCIF